MPYGRRGGEFVVNKKLVGTQYSPAVAGFASGGFIVVWESSDTLQDGAGYSIKAQRYDSVGNAVGSEILVNTSAAADQRNPSVTTLASGGYVVTWETYDTTQDGSGLAIKGQLFDAVGAPVGAEFRANSQLVADQSTPSVTGLEGGGFVVTWRTGDSTQDGLGGAIKGQIYSAAGAAVGGEFLVNTGAVGSENNPAVTGLAGGGFVATWTLGSGQQADIYGQVFDSSGARTGGQFLVNSTTALNQNYSSVSQISGGRFVVTWESSASTTSLDTEIRARIFSANGTPLGADFLVSTSRFDPDGGFRLSSYQPSVDDLPNGGFVITWTHSSGLAARSSIRGQYFDSNGNRVGSEVLVSTVTDRFEERGDVAVDGNGMVFAVWGSVDGAGSSGGTDIHGQLYGPSGAPAITSNGGGDRASVTIAENQNGVTTVSAVDPEGSALVYSIVGGVDASFFTINASTGVLTFVSSPSYEFKLDWDNNGAYDVVVSVSDGVMTDIQALTVTVSDVNEAPVISGTQTNYVRVENGTAVATFTAADPEGSTVTWSIAGGADAARFAIDSASGALRFVAAPDFETPGDAGVDNVYNVTIAASDGSLTATRALTVQVSNQNEGPVITSGGGGTAASVSVAENTALVTTVVADDPDATDSPFSFSIAGGADAGLFVINAQTGQLSFKSASGANFEAPADANGNNVYEVTVSVSDGTAPADTQALSITVTNVNEAPVITSSGGGATASLSLAENRLAVTTVTATDVDSGALTFAIAGGADASLFAIDAQTGMLSFVSAPDREAPRDSGGDNGYDVTVSVSDGQKSDTQMLSVSILDVDETPVITSNGGGSAAAILVAENGLSVTTVAAADPEHGALSYLISGGADASRFLIDSATGALSFLIAPDFERPGDQDGDNVYEVTVGASDGASVGTQALSITVGNENERPRIVSNGGGTSASISHNEGGMLVTTVVALDDGPNPVRYSITGGWAADLFVLDPVSGHLSFRNPPDYENPAEGSSNFYSVYVTADDGELSSFQLIQVMVNNVYEDVRFAEPSLGFEVNENSQAVGSVSAIADSGMGVHYSIVGGADGAQFTIDPATGELSFAAAPNFEASSDSNGDNIYTVTVAASDGTTSALQYLSILVRDVDEPVAFVSYGAAKNVALTVVENGVSVGEVLAYDGDGSDVTYSIDGGADAARFQVDPQTGKLSFVHAGRPDFEHPSDSDTDNVYQVTVRATSGGLSATQSFSVAVANVNEGIWITSNGGGSSAGVWVDENQRSVTTVTAWDPDGTTPLFQIVGGADASLFTIDSRTGVLSFIDAPDFEAPRDANGDHVYDVTVAATDGDYATRQDLAVTVRNVDEAVEIVSYGGADIVIRDLAENSTSAARVEAVDADGGAVTFSITGGEDAALFAIDSASGALRFIAAPDFEHPADANGDNKYMVTVTASAGGSNDSQMFGFLVVNVNEGVLITSNGGGPGASVAVAENGRAVTTLAAEDLDGSSPTFAIVGGADSSLFTIDAQTGALQFVSAPDREAPKDADGDNIYNVVVRATDGSLFDEQALAVTVTNVDEGLAIVSYGGDDTVFLSRPENGSAVAQVKGVDQDGDPVTYQIVGGADAARFRIDAATGELSFVAPPDFEAPADANADNVYKVEIAAVSGSFIDKQVFAVTVTNANEALAIVSNGGGASASLSISENSRTVTTVLAADPEGAQPSYSIVGGTDAARFTINAQSGLLQFVTAPDYELPTDSNADNVYSVIVQASDGLFSDVQTLSVTVLNVSEGATVTGTAGNDSISGTSTNPALRTTEQSDSVFGRDGHDTILGLGGDDIIDGEAGNDTITGGAGADRLTGGLGKDQFVYNSVSESTPGARDVITDFSRSQGDKISLSGIDASTRVAGDQAFTFIGTAAFSGVAGQLRYSASGGVTLVSGDVNGDGIADFQIELSGTLAPVASDFLL